MGRKPGGPGRTDEGILREAETALGRDPQDVDALAVLVRCHAARGRRADAAAAADRALASLRAGGGRRRACDWDALIEGLAALGDDRQLYRVYAGCLRARHVPLGPWTALRVGVAAANLGRAQEARWLWRSVPPGEEAAPFAAALLFVLDLVEGGAVPPFALDYAFSPGGAAAEGTHVPGSVKVLALESLWRGTDLADRAAALDLLGGAEEPWAAAFLYHVLRSPDLPDPLKVKAAGWLLERGLLEPGEPVEIHLEGELQRVSVSRKPAAPSAAAVRWLERALGARRRGRWDESERALRRSLQASPDFLPALVGLADLCRRRGRLGEAEGLLRQALQADPHEPLVTFDLASLLAQRQELGLAQELLSRLDPMGLEPGDRAAYYALEGHLDLQAGRLRKAEKTFRAGLALAPDDRRLQAGLVAARMGLARDALARWRAAAGRRQPGGTRPPAGPGMAWESALATRTRAELVGLARRVGGVRGAARLRKALLAGELAARLRETLDRELGSLQEAELEVLRWLAARGGHASYDALSGPGRSEAVLEGLQDRGLLFVGPAQGHPPRRAAWLPREVTERVSAPTAAGRVREVNGRSER